MTFLPVVQRELLVRSRHPWTYRGRLVAAAVPLLIVAAMSMAGNPNAGQIMLNVLVFLTGAFCLFEGVRTTADCISSEKREGTLGLLFLTDLRGYDVVLGKFASATLGSLYGLLAMFPVIGLTMLFGGVTSGEFWRTVVALANLMFGSLAMGMLVSVLAHDQARALAGTALALLLWLGLPLLFGVPAALGFGSVIPWVAWVSPLDALQKASSGLGYGSSLAMAHAAGWIVLMTSCFLLPRTWRVGRGSRTTNPAAMTRPTAAPALRAESPERSLLLTTSPMAWMLSRSRERQGPFVALLVVIAAGSGTLAWLLGSVSIIAITIGGLTSIAAMMVHIRVAWCSAECLAGLRSSGLLDLILVTPMRPRELVDDLAIGLWKRFGNLLVLLAGLQILGILSFVAMGDVRMLPTPFAPGPTNLVWSVNLFADFFALGYTGLYLGLQTGRAVPAFVRTMLLVFLGGSLCCGIRFIPELLLITFMRQRLERRLREIASGDSRSPRVPTHHLLRPPPPAPPGIPPVIASTGR